MAFVWFGDSIAAGKTSKPASWFLDSVGVFAFNNGVAGTGSAEVLAAVSAYSFQPGDIAVIHSGINDLSNGLAGPTVAANLGAAVAAVPSGVTVCVLPVLPFKNIPAAIETERLLCNAHLGADVPEFFASGADSLLDETGMVMLAECLTDGIHLTALAQRRLALAVLQEYAPAAFDPLDWTFAGTPYADWPAAFDTLGARWEVWPKLLADEAGRPYAHGYCGALASANMPAEFTARATFSVKAGQAGALCSIVTKATPTDWLQFGWNIAAGPLVRALHWRKGGGSTYFLESNPLLSWPASAILGGRQRIELSVTQFDGLADFHAGTPAEGATPRKLDYIGRIPTAGAMADGFGFWFAHAALESFHVGPAELTGQA